MYCSQYLNDIKPIHKIESCNLNNFILLAKKQYYQPWFSNTLNQKANTINHNDEIASIAFFYLCLFLSVFMLISYPLFIILAHHYDHNNLSYFKHSSDLNASFAFIFAFWRANVSYFHWPSSSNTLVRLQICVVSKPISIFNSIPP